MMHDGRNSHQDKEHMETKALWLESGAQPANGMIRDMPDNNP